MKRSQAAVLVTILVVAIAAAGCAAKKPPEPPAEPAPTDLNVTLKTTLEPTASLTQVSHDAAGPKKPGDVVRFDVGASVPEGYRLAVDVGKTAWKPRVGAGAPDRFSAIETVPDVPPGRYDVVASVLDPSGKVVATKSAPTPIEIVPAKTAVEIAQERLRALRVHFGYDSSDLSASAKQEIEAVAGILKTVASAGCSLIVEGHCDERGTVEYNLALGQRRAAAVADYLVALGVVTRDRARTVSYGKERPLVDGHDESAWSQNRRADFILDGCK